MQSITIHSIFYILSYKWIAINILSNYKKNSFLAKHIISYNFFVTKTRKIILLTFVVSICLSTSAYTSIYHLFIQHYFELAQRNICEIQAVYVKLHPINITLHIRVAPKSNVVVFRAQPIAYLSRNNYPDHHLRRGPSYKRRALCLSKELHQKARV